MWRMPMHTDLPILSLSLHHCLFPYPPLNFICLSRSHLTSPPLLSFQLLFSHSVLLALFIFSLFLTFTSISELLFRLSSRHCKPLSFHSHSLVSSFYPLSFCISIKILQYPNCLNRLAALVSKFRVVAVFHSCSEKQMRVSETWATKWHINESIWNGIESCQSGGRKRGAILLNSFLIDSYNAHSWLAVTCTAYLWLVSMLLCCHK